MSIGRVGPVKDSLTYRPSSQGWALRVLPPLICVVCVVACLCVCFLCGIYIYMYMYSVSLVGCLSFLSYFSVNS